MSRPTLFCFFVVGADMKRVTCARQIDSVSSDCFSRKFPFSHDTLLSYNWKIDRFLRISANAVVIEQHQCLLSSIGVMQQEEMRRRTQKRFLCFQGAKIYGEGFERIWEEYDFFLWLLLCMKTRVLYFRTFGALRRLILHTLAMCHLITRLMIIQD